jgi:hypothetical protein
MSTSPSRLKLSGMMKGIRLRLYRVGTTLFGSLEIGKVQY